MALPAATVTRFIDEVRAISAAAYALSQRARQLSAKTDANGLYAEAAPPGSDADMDIIRAAYNGIVLAQIALFNNTAINSVDRTALHWQINRELGV
jgi:hypothetical protein